MTNVESVVEEVRGDRDRYVTELKEYLSIPSISTLPEHKADVERTARWISSQLEHMGIEKVEVVPTEGHPMVLGEWLKAPSSNHTILVYGHYDVQPVDPLNEWESPPFTPTVRGDEIFARGAADMKGQGHALLKSVEAWMSKTGGLPTNVKFIFEGEEEIGSPHIDGFLEKHKERLHSSFCLNCDAGIAAPDKPSITQGLRGIVYFEVGIRGPAADLHSGVFGGIVRNPAIVMSELIAGLHDEDGRVTLEGFYDKVRRLTKEEREEIAANGPTDEEWKKMAGVRTLYGEKGFTSTERVGARPTLEVNGMISGFTGVGMKTVIGAAATAKISTRTVPYQDPNQIEASLRKYFAKNVPDGIEWEVKKLVDGPYAILERGTPELEAASKALEATYKKKPFMKLEGGSVPLVAIIKNRLGVNSVNLGCGISDAHIHSPNERLHLPTYFKGIETYVRFFDLVGKSG